MNEIGLEEKKVKKLATSLNELLANYHIHYQRCRGFHWNVKGTNFFELHARFELYYTDAINRIDLIAERILTLGQPPVSNFSDYLKTSQLKEMEYEIKDMEMVTALIGDFQTLIDLERGIINGGDDMHDDATVDMMTEFIAFQEKTIWMLKSFLSKR